MNGDLCINCMNCREKNGIVFCSIGNFSNKVLEEVMFFVPEDFDCEDFESDEEEN